MGANVSQSNMLYDQSQPVSYGYGYADSITYNSYSLPNNGDIALVAEGRSLYFNSDLLCRYSPVFAKLIRSNGFVVNGRQLLLPDKKASDIQEMLQCLNVNPQKPLTDSSIPIVVPLAQEYEIATLIDRATTYLHQRIDRANVDVAVIFLTLSEAITFGFRTIADACLRRAVRLPYQEIHLLRSRVPPEVYADLLDKQYAFTRAAIRSSFTESVGDSYVHVCRMCRMPTPIETCEVNPSFVGYQTCTCRKVDTNFNRLLDSLMVKK